MSSCVNCNCSPCSCQQPFVPFAPLGCTTTACPPRLFEEIGSFVLPEIGAGVPVTVCDASNWLVGCCVIVKDGISTATLSISAVSTTTNSITLTNDSAVGNPVPGTVFAAPTNLLLRPGCPETTTDVNPSFSVGSLVQQDPGSTIITMDVPTSASIPFDLTLPLGPITHPLVNAGVLPTPLPLVNPISDNLSALDLPNDGYVIPQDGVYTFNGTAEVGEHPDTDAHFAVGFGRNDNEVLPWIGQTSSSPTVLTHNVTLYGSTIVPCVTGDVVKLYLYFFDANVVVQKVDALVEYVYFGGFKISP